jgi:hypothetical protein
VNRWLLRNPRFTPTGTSWLNLVERFPREITNKLIRVESTTS